MINPDDLPLVDIFDEHSLSRDQVKTLITLLRDFWKTVSAHNKDNYHDIFFNYRNQRHTSALHQQMLTSIREALNFTEEQMDAASRCIVYWMNQALFARDPQDHALYSHSVLSNQPVVQPVRFVERYMDTGASSVLFGFLSGSTRLLLAQRKCVHHAAVKSQLHQKVQQAVFHHELLFGVPDVLMPTQRAEDEEATTLSQLVETTRQCLNTDKMLVFRTKHEAYLYAYSRRLPASFRPDPTHAPIIITLAPLGNERPYFQILDQGNCHAPLACAYADPRDFVGLKVDLYKGHSNQLNEQFQTQIGQSALLKTPFDPPLVVTPRSRVPNLTPLNRQLGHRLFMRSMQHRISSPQDFLCWLDEFYCDQYLVQKRKGDEKRAALKAAIADIRAAEKFGLDLGTDVYFCLQLIPIDETLEHLLRDERLFKPDYDFHSFQYVAWRSKRVWGLKTAIGTFLAPKLSRHEREKAHHDFMQSLGEGPFTLKDISKWFQSFYSPYLLGQKNGREKVQRIHACYEAILRDFTTDDLTIEEFLDKIPAGHQHSLKMIIGDRRRGSPSQKPSWGWQTIEASFIEPERAQIAEGQARMANSGI